ncbi:MAG: glutamate-1-semialdehyde 2,1-aminomutase [Chloroflexota bacterium]|nr:glutamate-1-semialdehyde 2,1-aminomutase [Chloroflexota bacterium]MDE3268245.1 glutamate-1-semialdehyde 2,1-aminomutase [Chloroflexota bacterium]
MDTSRSADLFRRAQALIPGGVNSPVRSFRAVGGGPHFIRRGSGSRVWDEDGNEFIDYVGSWGPLILGHAHPEVVEALADTLAMGLSFGAPTAGELELAEIITGALPSVEMVRLVSSGTEAAMSAVRAARAYTGREKIIKFAGCYHGHADGLLVEAGSGGATYSVPNSAGVPAAYAGETLVAHYNDLTSVERLFEAHQGGVAAVILEPVAGNVGVIPPADGFLEGLRSLTTREGALLIFDEVITGFRVAYGGAQTLYGVTPDLTCLGKIIGGGLPVGAYGGRREVMEVVAPLGSMYQAGTLSGNPLAVTAGIATIKVLARPGVYDGLESVSSRLAKGIAAAAAETHLPLAINRVGSMMSVFFNSEPVVDADSAMASDRVRYAAYFRRMLEDGVYLAPSAFEAAFVSTAHTVGDVEYTIGAAARALEPHPAQ